MTIEKLATVPQAQNPWHQDGYLDVIGQSESRDEFRIRI